MRASERAYQALLADIVDGALEPGTVLAEVEQAARLGVSRTPLREALAQLRKDGLVVPQAGRGLIVSEIDRSELTEIYELRQALEQHAVRLAASRREVQKFAALATEFRNAPALLAQGEAGIRSYYNLNERLDQTIEDCIASPYLTSALKSVHLHLARIRRLTRHNPERLLAAASETLVIVEAIQNGDADLAAHATHVHLHQSLQASLASLNSPALAARVA